MGVHMRELMCATLCQRFLGVCVPCTPRHASVALRQAHRGLGRLQAASPSPLWKELPPLDCAGSSPLPAASSGAAEKASQQRRMRELRQR